jgi:hypothetical protein
VLPKNFALEEIEKAYANGLHTIYVLAARHNLKTSVKPKLPTDEVNDIWEDWSRVMRLIIFSKFEKAKLLLTELVQKIEHEEDIDFLFLSKHIFRRVAHQLKELLEVQESLKSKGSKNLIDCEKSIRKIARYAILTEENFSDVEKIKDMLLSLNMVVSVNKDFDTECKIEQ